MLDELMEGSYGCMKRRAERRQEWRDGSHGPAARQNTERERTWKVLLRKINLCKPRKGCKMFAMIINLIHIKKTTSMQNTGILI